jgi:hypothetical protein
MVIWCFVLAWAIVRALQNGRVDYEYAKQGLVSPRLQAKYAAQAQERVARYGLFDFVRDAYRDSMARRTDALVAARDAKATGRDPKAAAATVLGEQPKPSPKPRATKPSTTPAAAQIPQAVPAAVAPKAQPVSDAVPAPATNGPEPAAPVAPKTDQANVTPGPAEGPADETSGESATTTAAVPAAGRSVGRHAAPDKPVPGRPAGNVIPFPNQQHDGRDLPATNFNDPQEREHIRRDVYALCAHVTRAPGHLDDYCKNPCRPGSAYCWEHGEAPAPTNNTEDTMTNPTPALPTVPTGEATTIPQFMEQAKSIALHVAALKERLSAAIADLTKTVETFEASAAAIEVPAQLANKIAGAREAVAALAASQNGAMEEFNGAMLAVRAEFAQHMAGVEVAASTGGLAKAGAYQAG